MSSILNSTIDPLFAANGFTVVRKLWSAEEAESLAASLADACAPTPDATVALPDLVTRMPSLRSTVFDERILSAVRACLGPEIRFVRDFALQINRHSVGWHRDSACPRYGAGGDFREEMHPYAVVKVILYLAGGNAGLAVLPGSHRDPMTDIRFDETPDAYRWIRAGETVTGPLNVRPDVRPAVVDAEAGDAIIFDLRLLHCARSLDAGSGRWIMHAPGGNAAGWQGDKIVLHICFGLDNVHSERFHSYMRYRRPELYGCDLDPAFVAELGERGLLLSAGLGNLFERAPAELEGVYDQQTFAAELAAARPVRAQAWLTAVRGLMEGRDRIALWGVGPDLDGMLSQAPDVDEAVVAGRIAVVDEDGAGRRFRGTTVTAPAAWVDLKGPVVLAPYCANWRESLRREAARLGIAAARIVDVPFDPDLEYNPVNAFDPGWTRTG